MLLAEQVGGGIISKVQALLKAHQRAEGATVWFSLDMTTNQVLIFLLRMLSRARMNRENVSALLDSHHANDVYTLKAVHSADSSLYSSLIEGSARCRCFAAQHRLGEGDASHLLSLLLRTSSLLSAGVA
jgi:hypothetical protein